VDYKAFEQSPAGILVPSERGQRAFVPYPLPPPNIDLRALAEPLERAASALGELDGLGRVLPNPYLLIAPLQGREALSSSTMEGTYTTADNLLLLDAGASEVDQSQDTREVLNYRHALSSAISSLETIPLSLRTLKDAHRTLMSNVRFDRGLRARPGEFKEHQNFIGAYEVEKARFIPPPRHESLECLDKLERYFHDESNGLPVLINSALIHYQFETIHPFADGNGRVGRMLITLHLYHARKIRLPLLYLSPALEGKKDEYIDRMYAVSAYGAWTEWIKFYLDTVVESSNFAIEIADRLIGLQKKYREKFQKANRSAGILAIIDRLFNHPAFSIPMIAEEFGISYPAAKANVDKLLSENIVQEAQNTSHPRFYIAKEIISSLYGK
jgi:Fic family protein